MKYVRTNLQMADLMTKASFTSLQRRALCTLCSLGPKYGDSGTAKAGATEQVVVPKVKAQKVPQTSMPTPTPSLITKSSLPTINMIVDKKRSAEKTPVAAPLEKKAKSQSSPSQASQATPSTEQSGAIRTEKSVSSTASPSLSVPIEDSHIRSLLSAAASISSSMQTLISHIHHQGSIDTTIPRKLSSYSLSFASSCSSPTKFANSSVM